MRTAWLQLSTGACSVWEASLPALGTWISCMAALMSAIERPEPLSLVQGMVAMVELPFWSVNSWFHA